MAKADSRAILSHDTGAAAEQLQVELWRAMPAAAKARSAADASAATVQLALAGIRMRHPEASRAERFDAFARLTLGVALARQVYGSRTDPSPIERTTVNPIDVALVVAGALEACGLRYVVGGSLASSVAGEPRSTIDIDLMVEIAERDVPCVLGKLGAEFYAEPQAFTRAIRDRSSVNVIHMPSAIKADLFIMGALPIEPEQMDRRQSVTVASGSTLYVYTPEDILLQKLHWYALGGGTSDRQWRDILGIILVQTASLDRTYLRRAAAEIGAGELLERALAEARPPTP